MLYLDYMRFFLDYSVVPNGDRIATFQFCLCQDLSCPFWRFVSLSSYRFLKKRSERSLTRK